MTMLRNEFEIVALKTNPETLKYLVVVQFRVHRVTDWP